MPIVECNPTLSQPTTMRARRETPPTGPRIAVINPPDEHLVSLLRILRGYGYKADWMTDCKYAVTSLAGAAIPVVICERDLPDGNWRDVMTQTDLMPQRPLLIVTSMFADERLWVEVLNLGGYDVLQKPFDEKEVVGMVGQAFRCWLRTRVAGPVSGLQRTA